MRALVMRTLQCHCLAAQPSTCTRQLTQSATGSLIPCCSAALPPSWAGHYVALVRTPSGQWVCFDDEQVNAVTESQARSALESCLGVGVVCLLWLGALWKNASMAGRSTLCQTATFVCSTVCCSEADSAVCRL